MFSNKISVVLLMVVILMAIPGKVLSRSDHFINSDEARAELRWDIIGQWSDEVRSRFGIVCDDALKTNENKSTKVYLGLQFGEFEPILGWNFLNNEWVTGLRYYPKWDNKRGYLNFEYQFWSQRYYYHARIEFSKVGFEAEGRGYINDHLVSNGFGPYLIFNLQPRYGWRENNLKFRVEAGVQYHKFGPEAVVRFTFTSY